MPNTQLLILVVMLLVLVCPLSIGILLYMAASWGIPFALIPVIIKAFGIIYIPITLGLMTLLGQVLCPGWTDVAITYLKLKCAAPPTPQAGD